MKDTTMAVSGEQRVVYSNKYYAGELSNYFGAEVVEMTLATMAMLRQLRDAYG
jgi:hypothetical protein